MIEVTAQIRTSQALPFAALPHALLHDFRLTPNDKVLAGHLLGFARSKTSCWPSNARLANDLGVSVRTVQYGLRRLEGAGWVRCVESEENRTGRLIVLAWREVAGGPQGVAGGPVQPVAPERDRVVKEKLNQEIRIPSTTRAAKTPPEAPRPTVMVEPIQTPRTATFTQNAQTPALRPEVGRRPSRADIMAKARADMASLASTDPILAAELAKRNAPTPPPRPEPTSVEDLIERVRDCPSYPSQIAHALTIRFADQGSYSNYHAIAHRAWRGELPVDVLREAFRQATGPDVRKPGAVLNHVIRRWEGSR